MILKINYVILIVRNKNINAKLSLFIKMSKKEKDIKEKLFFLNEDILKLRKTMKKKKILSSIKVALNINLMIIIFQQLKSGKEYLKQKSMTMMKLWSISVAQL